MKIGQLATDTHLPEPSLRDGAIKGGMNVTGDGTITDKNNVEVKDPAVVLQHVQVTPYQYDQVPETYRRLLPKPAAVPLEAAFVTQNSGKGTVAKEEAMPPLSGDLAAATKALKEIDTDSPRGSMVSWQKLTRGLASQVFKPTTDGVFGKDINDKTADAVLAGLGPAQALANQYTEKGTPFVVVLTLGAADKAANGTNHTGGIHPIAFKQQNELAFAQDTGGKKVIHIKIDDAGKEPETQGDVTTFTIRGAYPLVDRPGQKGQEVQEAMRNLATRAIESGGQLVLRNFITDKLYPGLFKLINEARIAGKQAAKAKTGDHSPAPVSVSYTNEYLADTNRPPLHLSFISAPPVIFQSNQSLAAFQSLSDYASMFD